MFFKWAYLCVSEVIDAKTYFIFFFNKSYSKVKTWAKIIICPFESDLKARKIYLLDALWVSHCSEAQFGRGVN